MPTINLYIFYTCFFLLLLKIKVVMVGILSLYSTIHNYFFHSSFSYYFTNVCVSLSVVIVLCTEQYNKLWSF